MEEFIEVGTIFTYNEINHLGPMLLSKLLYSPVTWVDVERSAFIAKHIFTDGRQMLLMENVETGGFKQNTEIQHSEIKKVLTEGYKEARKNACVVPTNTRCHAHRIHHINSSTDRFSLLRIEAERSCFIAMVCVHYKQIAKLRELSM